MSTCSVTALPAQRLKSCCGAWVCGVDWLCTCFCVAAAHACFLFRRHGGTAAKKKNHNERYINHCRNAIEIRNACRTGQTLPGRKTHYATLLDDQPCTTRCMLHETAPCHPHSDDRVPREAVQLVSPRVRRHTALLCRKRSFVAVRNKHNPDVAHCAVLVRRRMLPTLA